MSRSKHINELIASRRALLGGMVGLPLLNLAGCATATQGGDAASGSASANFTSVPPTNADTVSLPPGYSWRKLIAWGDALFDTVSPVFDPNTLTRAEQEQRFGQNNDMLALFAAEYAFPPPRNQDRMILCANNEYTSSSLAFPGVRTPSEFTAEQVAALYAAVGVSVVEVERTGQGWHALRNPAPGQGRNRRITPFTPVTFSGPAANHPWIAQGAAVTNEAEPGAPANTVACGTGANCAGGLTPWGTYLTAEENFDGLFVGSDRAQAMRDARQDDSYALDSASFGYPSYYEPFSSSLAPRQFQVSENPYGPSLYGWVVEIDPYDPNSTPKKRTALGRKKQECATTALTRDGRVAVYMGDDQRNEYVYKFVTDGRFNPSDRAANMDLLDHGKLYCAQFHEDGGVWLHITAEAANAAAAAQDSPIRFRDQGDVLMRVREAARLMGATPMDRPEDVEAVCDANWRGLGPVLIACTNNSERGFERPGNPRRESERPNSAQSNLAGHVLRIDEAGGDCGAERFTWDIFAMGGDPNAETLTTTTRGGMPAHISTKIDGVETVSGDKFACPDNLFIDSTHRVWIATDGNDGVFADCNDTIMVAPGQAEGPRPIKRFLVGPPGAEICGPLMTPDERAFLCAIQHPGANDVAGAEFSVSRWSGAPVPSHFPDGGESWPRSAVVVITRDDGGRIGD
ncbi:PhoX family protein [Vitreimonas flagellata]|uniref:PhoX family protein n=1 Tax=Vitreimonas flagellata TaxID=2560861 RepID=UPI00142F8DBF|nr:PhoX family phosphatase [Vitreimonas flagellata]